MQRQNSPLKFALLQSLPFKPYLALHFLVILYAAIDISLWPYLSKLLINGISASGPEHAFADNKEILALFLFFTFLPGIIWRLSDYAWIKMLDIKKNITIYGMNILMQQSQNFFQNNFAGALANKVRDVANSTPKIIDIFLYSFVRAFLIIFIALFALYSIHKFFAIGLIVWAVIFVAMAVGSARKTVKMSSQIAESASKITGNLVDVMSNIGNVRFFSNRDFERKRLNGILENNIFLVRTRNIFLLKFYTFHSITFSLYFCTCIIALVYLYSQGEVTIGDFAMIFTTNSFIIHEMWQAAKEMRHFLEEVGTAKQALEIIHHPIEIKNSITSKNFEIKENGGEIIFENVGFSYKEKKPSTIAKIENWELIGQKEQDEEIKICENEFFSNQSITIKAGQKVGLVGHSGSGKTTFVNLIMRAFDVDNGRILIDKQDISLVTLDSLRSAISLIPQEPTLFHRSLLDNIIYAKIDANKEDAIHASFMAHAHEFIKLLPQTYDSLVGERGVKLSGGQRQRIAIARAFLKNAPILILDEATSQLDSITENLIQESLENLMKNRTTLVIAHRLSTIQNMDRILVFDKGKIVEDGSHAQLLAQNGTYKKLWDAQIGGFLQDD